MKTRLKLIWEIPLIFLFALSCTELELNKVNKTNVDDINLDSRLSLSKELLDSTVNAEKSVRGNQGAATTEQAVSLASITSVNYAPQANVSAESTYPGYSVLKIIDRNRTTTVGPSYSWANNYPAGGRLPESVFLTFTSLKKVDRIDIYTSSGYALQNYTIQYRVTPTGGWINLVVVTGNTSIIRSHTFTAVDLLEVQIICQLGPPNQTIYGRLNEVEIYGPAEPPLPPISVENGMLVFSSSTDVEQAMAYLEYKYEQYSDAFFSQYAGLSDDQLSDIEEATGFNDEQPYIDFENQYGISSLRAQITAAEDNWLETTAGDSTAGPDPDDSYMDEDELRTLVNSNGELKVGSAYYHFLSDDSYYIDGGTAIQSSSATFVGTTCRATVKNVGFIYASNFTWRIKYKVKVHDGPFAGSGKAKAITKSYKKKSGRWKKRASTIGAQVYGEIVAGDCTGGTSINSGYKQKRARKVKAKVSFSGGKVEKNAVSSDHYQSSVGTYMHSLTW
jgi:hypothetical protein